MCAFSDAGDNLPPTSQTFGSSESGGKEANAKETSIEHEQPMRGVALEPLQVNGVSPEPHGRRGGWQALLSHVLDAVSALFSLACGSATLACMGVLEWSTLATLGVFVASLSTAIGSLMVVATAAVGVLALFDTLRTSAADEDAEEDPLQALAAPPRRLGSMGGNKALKRMCMAPAIGRRMMQ